MKLVISIAVGIVIGGSFPNASAGTPLQKQESTTKSFQIPSKEIVRELISGEWENNIGPNPSNMRITRNTIWNSQCWERYRILGVRPAKMNKADAYVVEIEVTSSGGPQVGAPPEVGS